jgi:hypothetical protein
MLLLLCEVVVILFGSRDELLLLPREEEESNTQESRLFKVPRNRINSNPYEEEFSERQSGYVLF